jgi:hypothetical protein
LRSSWLAGKKLVGVDGVLAVEFGGYRGRVGTVEHPAVRSRKKLQKVYVLMSEGTRARLKAVAGLKGMRLFDLLDQLCTDFIRGWEDLAKIDLGKLIEGQTKPSTKRKVKTKTTKATKRTKS